MKTLLILRHAKSSWKNNNLADHERPLNKRGRRDAPRMGRWLKEQGLTPDLIISSSAERALATAEAVALASDYDGEINVTRQLYHAAPFAYLDAAKALGDDAEKVMVVGHNPGLGELITYLARQSIRVPTATLAHVTLELDEWADLDEETPATVHAVWRPKELPAEAD
jgi:phosphohistidine phosphatase